MGIEIKTLTEHDAKQLLKVWEDTWKTTYQSDEKNITEDSIVLFFNKFREESFFDRFAKSIKSTDKSIYYGAYHQKGLVGFIHGEKGDKKNNIHALYILKKEQGRGIGSQLLKKIEDWFSSQKKITLLEVADFNVKAQDFFKKAGFIFTGNKKEFKFNEKFKIIGLIMEKPNS